MNQVGLVGRITKDPVLKQLSEERHHTNFVLAINRSFKNSQGTIDADFIFCVANGKMAEHIVKYCGKGSLVGVNGRIQTRSYLNRDNQKVYTTEIVIEDVRFYALKSPGVVDRIEQEKPIPVDFMLPEVEDPLPLVQV
ncbi:MAG: single-stranded DNA-binding protein [Solibacillus sp.]|jgi:single-strand DNA-binding protein|uniref:single-stranded DNA-binding protein n=1 Tax=unclassified Solibacillus TaxID=2637870 RepID=UPI0030F78E30